MTPEETVQVMDHVRHRELVFVEMITMEINVKVDIGDLSIKTTEALLIAKDCHMEWMQRSSRLS